MCLCVCFRERENRGRRKRVREREGHCCYYDPPGLRGLGWVCGGVGTERVWEIYSQKTGLAYGEQSWLTEHLSTHTNTQMGINQLRQISLTFHYFAPAWHPETMNCTKFSPPQRRLTENLSNCRITQTVISRYSRLFQLWSGYISFEVVNSPWALWVEVTEERKRVDKKRTPYTTLCLVQWVGIFWACPDTRPFKYPLMCL